MPSIGAGVVVWPNAAYVLEQLGVLDEVAAVSGRVSRMRRLSQHGEDLGALDIGAINRQMGYPSYSILRRDLNRILLARLAALGVAVDYAHAVSRIEVEQAERALVHFEDGKVIGADVVIGADGRMASCARQFVLGESAPVYQGFINWIGVFESDVDTFDELAVADYWGIGERFGIVPVSARKAYWAGGMACPTIGPKNPADYNAELRALFAGWPQAVQMMVEQTPLAHINKIYVHDHHPVQTWHKHRVIMIGDAAHAPLPTSGQGACQALEDAWCLARQLADSPRDVERAFVAFTEQRFVKTTNIIMAARGFAASLFNRDAAFCKTRNENSKRTDFAKMAAGMAQGWSQGLPLGAGGGRWLG